MPNEFACESLSICEHRWQVLYELPHFASEASFPLLVEHGRHSQPTVGNRFACLG